MQVLVTSFVSGRTLCLHINNSDEKVSSAAAEHVKRLYAVREGIAEDSFRLTRNGRLLGDDDFVFPEDVLRAVASLPGGKGGFGSMLRAIGAQIEKTTNREACRDLSGRRLRDINEEARLKKWMAQQEERERERRERRKAKLERLKELPKHQFEDTDYHKKREELPEQIASAVSQGLATSSQSTRKRPAQSSRGPSSKKGLWIDPDLGSVSESSSSAEDDGNKDDPTSTSAFSERESTENSSEAKEESNDAGGASAEDLPDPGRGAGSMERRPSRDREDVRDARN